MTYTTYFGVEHLDKIFHATTIAFDTETLQLQPEVGKLRLLQFGAESTKSIVVIDLFDTDENGMRKLDHFFENGDRHWIAHNAVFDLAWLQENGFKPHGRMYCTMLASKLLNNGIPNLKHGLAHLAKRYLDKDISKEQQTSDWSAPVLSKEQLEYAAKDVEILLELDAILPGKIAAAGLDPAYSLECKALTGNGAHVAHRFAVESFQP